MFWELHSLKLFFLIVNQSIHDSICSDFHHIPYMVKFVVTVANNFIFRHQTIMIDSIDVRTQE